MTKKSIPDTVREFLDGRSQRRVRGEIFIGGGVNFEFLSYCWAFYNPIDGVYPVQKGLPLDAMNKACRYIADVGHPDGYEWGGGDTDDQASALQVLLIQNPELKNPYDR